MEQRKEETEIRTGLQKLTVLYGDDFPWMLLPQENGFLRQAEKEITEGHPLYLQLAEAIAKCEANDDVVFRLNDGRFALVHLTWQNPTNPAFPRYALFDTATNLLTRIQMQFMDGR